MDDKLDVRSIVAVCAGIVSLYAAWQRDRLWIALILLALSVALVAFAVWSRLSRRKRRRKAPASGQESGNAEMLSRCAVTANGSLPGSAPEPQTFRVPSRFQDRSLNEFEQRVKDATARRRDSAPDG